MTLKYAMEVLTKVDNKSSGYMGACELRVVKEAIRTVRSRRKVWQDFRELADRVEHDIGG